MDKAIQAQQIFDEFQHRLGLKWVAGSRGAQRTLSSEALPSSRVNLVTYLNIVHPPLIQVLGETELDFLGQLGKNSLHDTLNSLFSHSLMVVVSAPGRLSPLALEMAENHQVPVCSAQSPCEEVINQLQYYLSRLFARQETLHGVFLEVLGMGVLLSGGSGIGKSELALELISRGHRLIADDAPAFIRTAPDTINGSCPKVLSGFLEVRGLGVLDIPAMFGDSAIKINKNLRLIIDLQPESNYIVDANDRIYGSMETRSVLGVEIPQLTLPVASGRNLAVLVEGAVRNHLLRIRGYNAADAFVKKHSQLLDNPNP